MPWSPESYKSKHNKGLTMPQAKKAARQANALLRAGVPEGEAIATANKHAKAKPKPTHPAGREIERRLAAKDKR